MLQKITSERHFLHPVLKPIQQPVFRLNKKGCTFLLEDTENYPKIKNSL